MLAQKQIRVLEGYIELRYSAITAVPLCIEAQRAENEGVEEDRVRVTSMAWRLRDEMRGQRRRFEDCFSKREKIQKQVRFALRSALRSMAINMAIAG